MDMASRRVLPPSLGLINRRFSTPAVASIVVGLLGVILTWIYLVARFGLRSDFFSISRETGPREETRVNGD